MIGKYINQFMADNERLHLFRKRVRFCKVQKMQRMWTYYRC